MSDPIIVPFARRVQTGPTAEFEELLRSKFGIKVAYRGTDPETGSEYYQLTDPPISFLVEPKKRLVVWNIGSDPDKNKE